MNAVCDKASFDPGDAGCLEEFKKVQMQGCPFAPKAKIWGSPEWNNHLSLTENLLSIIPSLEMFIQSADQKDLDGYIIEMPPEYGTSVESLAETTKEALSILSQNDPSKGNSLAKKVNDKKWQFTFLNMRLFVKAFAPCYDENHSRNASDSNKVYILFQPEFSFAKHGISRGSNPELRNSIREHFNETGRTYFREDIFESPNEAPRYITPAKLQDPVVDWWVD